MLDPRIAALLRDHFGLDPASIGTQGVFRVVAQRVDKVCSGDIEQYWQVVSQSAAELRILVEALVVPETWFFRYPESLDRVAACVVAMLRRRPDGSPVRILSMPCSTGEEPYSIAIALRDIGIAPAQVRIDALDISEVAIERARRGHYGRNAFRTASLTFRDRHFSALPDGGYALDDGIRAQVDLRCENIFALSPQTMAQPYDVVLCRNVLIYFDVLIQQRVIGLLEQLCRPEGALFLGPAEAGLLIRMGYRPVGEPSAFEFESRVDASRRYRAVPVPDARVGSAVPTPPRRPNPLGVPAAPAVLPASFVRPAPLPRVESGEAAIESVRRLADRGRIDEAAGAAQALIAHDSANPEAHYWLGLCRDVQGHKTEAEAYYRKAIYLAPAHVEALMHLAALLDEQGDDGGAQRLRQRAMREEARHGV